MEFIEIVKSHKRILDLEGRSGRGEPIPPESVANTGWLWKSVEIIEIHIIISDSIEIYTYDISSADNKYSSKNIEDAKTILKQFLIS